MSHWINWRGFFATTLLLILLFTLFFSRMLAGKIAEKERKNLSLWVEAQHSILEADDSANINLATLVSSGNIDIPVIETDESDHPTPNFLNLDTIKVRKNPTYLQEQLEGFKEYAPPIVMVIEKSPYKANKYYYGPSLLLKQIKYFPLTQLIIVCFFILLALHAQREDYKNSQNQVWAGLAKETAHQLGTPVSSLQGWTEVLKDIPGTSEIALEIEKDVERLQLVTDRFGKIGSKPVLEQQDIVERVNNMVEYIRKRAGGKVIFKREYDESLQVFAYISAPLFDWVIENLLKNALDALEGHGNISIAIHENGKEVVLDVSDSGKGMPRKIMNKIFEPGFTTKKRGWGLGLTLCKRIMEQYHPGKLFVLHSEVNKGTTFRITLPLDQS